MFESVLPLEGEVSQFSGKKSRHQVLVFVCFIDAGSILKVVSITQENWAAEEVVLEELQVFKVKQKKTNKQRLCSLKVSFVTAFVSYFRIRLPSSAWKSLPNR